MNLPPIEDAPLKTFSQCGEYYDEKKYQKKLLWTGPKPEREEDE
jgi:hypothetical protein